jgi:hypothetical protein
MPEKALEVSEVECCPDLDRAPACDTLNFRYRLPYYKRVPGVREAVKVEVILHFRLERCSGPLVLGDPAYTTTLLPGEQVRLFTSDRHSRWSYDSESSLAYRHETTSEESFFAAGMARAVSDLSVAESGFATSNYEESWAEGGGGASVDILGIIEIGGGGGGGSYDASSISTFARSLTRHAESASSYVAASVRAKSSTAIGEVERRSHAEGESEAQYESASRVFSNPNRCHAVTYWFYKVNKIQKIRFRLVAVERHVEDPQSPTGAFQRPPIDASGRVMVLPQAIRATDPRRLEIEETASVSAASRLRLNLEAAGLAARGAVLSGVRHVAARVAPTETITAEVRQKVLAEVDKELVATGLLDAKEKAPPEKLVMELSWEREETLPTPGLLVKGCLDTCSTCESALQKEIELDLIRKELENKKLERQIELLDKAQEYRCCPAGEEEGEDHD